jgi:cytochrome c oxidase subunit IV
MSASHVSNINTAKEIAPANTGKIWRVFWILLAITAVEFIIAFTKGPDVLNLSKILVISLFVGLTIVKAFYIVSEFMHLGHEAKVLIWSIILPLLFLVWFIIAMLNEGGYTHDAHLKSNMTTSQKSTSSHK